MFLGQWSIVAIISFVLMNAHRHLFGSIIGPTLLSSSKHGCHSFLFSISFLLLLESHFSPHISNWELVIWSIPRRIEMWWCIQCYCLGFTKATPHHIHFAFLELGPSLNDHHPQYFNSIIVVRFIVSLAHLSAFSMLHYVQCWDCCQYFLMHCVGYCLVFLCC